MRFLRSPPKSSRAFPETATFPLGRRLPPPLGPGQQRAIAIDYRNTGDKRLANLLVETNMRMVTKLAWQYGRFDRRLVPDLVQEGSLGLLEAIRRFDPDKGVRLVSYAGFWVRAFMLKFLLDNKRLVHPARTRASRAAFFRGEALPAELSLDEVADRDSGAVSLADRLADASAPADVVLEGAESARAARECVASFALGLDRRQEAILRQRLLSDDPEVLGSLGKRFSVSRERIRQIEKQICANLRKMTLPGPAVSAA
jgi:RNA polymerase sigma-32 factor